MSYCHQRLTEMAVYVNRKGFQSMPVQSVCDNNSSLTAVLGKLQYLHVALFFTLPLATT